MNGSLLRTGLLVLATTLAACGGPLPGPDGLDPQDPSGGEPLGECTNPPVYAEEVSACVPLASDYRPREPTVNGSSLDSWPACISDDNTYHRIQESISTIARVAAFEDIAAWLWKPGRVPSAQDFVEARVLYAQDQGLDSRVQRREDIHYPEPLNGAKCSEAGIPEQYPERCVGPARLLPVLNEAFQKGTSGNSPRVQAARIEAALLWFLYVSSLSEVTSCASKPQDCDSAWAYYTGGTERATPLGLARYMRALGPETHERAYDAVLAVRCWRNLDNETGSASNLGLRDQARAQLDRALLRGMALIVRQRFSELTCTSGEARAARMAFLQVLVPLLDRAARERGMAQAEVLMAQVQRASADEVDVPAALAALDALSSCP